MKLRLFFSIITGLLLFSSFSTGSAIALDQDGLLSDSNLKFIQSNIDITTSNPDKYDKGINVFGLFQGENDNPFTNNNSYLAMMDMDGKIDVQVAQHGRDFGPIDQVNETTFFTNYHGNPMLWNYKTNTTQTFDFAVNNHHDMAYNPQSKSFMIIERTLGYVTNQTGQQQLVLVDRLREYSMAGDILWQVNISDFVDASYYFEYYGLVNSTSTAKYKGPDGPPGTYLNIMHSNSIDWDYTHGKIFLNIRRMNIFIKIDYSTKSLDWIAGRHGNFTLLDKDGKNVTSLWYTPHDVSYIGNNEFLMFDNGSNNITRFLAGNKDPVKSSILRVKVNEDDMTIKEVFRWTGPKEFHSYHWGSAQLLPNGNYLGGFSSWYHSTSRSAEPYTTDFGGVAVEVTPTGEIVWEMKLPFLWGFFRIQRFFFDTHTSPSSSDGTAWSSLLIFTTFALLSVIVITKRKELL